ncbi:MAG: lysophospholipase L1-like esterase, partial [Myxococcota bacterium]
PDVRVSKEAYRANLTRLIEMASDAEVILLAFPHQEDRVGLWADVMAELPRPMIAPKLAPESFFANDPIHLNAAGHRLLAEQLAADLQLQSTPPPRR